MDHTHTHLDYEHAHTQTHTWVAGHLSKDPEAEAGPLYPEGAALRCTLSEWH